MIHGSETAVKPARRTAPKRLEPEPIGALTWLLVAVALVPLAVAMVRVLTGTSAGFHATSDNALNELLVRDVGRHPVLLGPFSRNDWSHPGPLFYYLTAIPYRLFGDRSSAMLVNALLINGVAIGVTITVAKRWGGLALALPVLLLQGLLITSLPLGFLENPWNPYITVLPFGAFLMVAWAATCGDRWAYPAAAFIGTFCMQTHIGYASLVIAVLAWCGWRAWRGRAGDGLVGGWWALAVLAVLWFPPVLEQIIHYPGNFRTIFHYFRTTTEPAHTITEGARVIGAQFSVAPDWLVGLRDINPFSGQPAALTSTPVPVLLIPFGVVVGLVVRSGDRRARHLVAVLVITLGVGILTLAGTVGSMYEYRLRWTWVLAGLCIAVTIAHTARAVARRITGQHARPAIAVCVAGTFVLGTFGIARTTSYVRPDVRDTKTLSALATAVLRELPKRPGVVLINATSFSSLTYLPGLVAIMERGGMSAKVDNRQANRVRFGLHRVYTGGPLGARLVIASGTDIEAIATRPGARIIAYVGRTPLERRAEALRRFDRLTARGVTAFDSRLIALGEDLLADAVFALPTSSGPHRERRPSRP